MEHKNTIIAIAISAIVSSLCTVAALNLGTNSKLNQNSDLSVISAQIEQLKNDLARETQARVLLAQQAFNPQRSNANSIVEAAKNPIDDPETAQALQDTVDSAEAAQRFRERRRSEQLARQQPDYRTQQLVSAGFAQEEAARIVQIESEESLRQLQAQYDSRRERAALDGNTVANQNPIRAELGDQNYQRYLEANGFPTSARVGSIIGGSPAEGAGLRAGDSVVSYAGERVFSLRDINNLTIQGNVGESVLIEVERAGESVQLTIPRGPIGISGGRRGPLR